MLRSGLAGSCEWWLRLLLSNHLQPRVQFPLKAVFGVSFKLPLMKLSLLDVLRLCLNDLAGMLDEKSLRTLHEPVKNKSQKPHLCRETRLPPLRSPNGTRGPTDLTRRLD
jgi:hypothetical protein